MEYSAHMNVVLLSPWNVLAPMLVREFDDNSLQEENEEHEAVNIFFEIDKYLGKIKDINRIFFLLK